MQPECPIQVSAVGGAAAASNPCRSRMTNCDLRTFDAFMVIYAGTGLGPAAQSSNGLQWSQE
jgi:hypothetical protein